MAENDKILGAIADLAQATGEGIDRVNAEIGEVKEHLSLIDQRLGRIEDQILADHQGRIQRLEKHVGITD